MILFHKKYLPIALTVGSVVCSQVQATPSSALPPLPYISYPGQGCSVFRDYPHEFQQSCSHYTFWNNDFPAGAIVINQARGADISEAGENWLILADGRSGTIKVTEDLPLRLKHHQVLMGVKFNKKKPILSFSGPSTPHLIHVQEADVAVRGLQLEGVDSGSNGALLYINKAMDIDVASNIFNTTPTKSVGIDINDDQNDQSMEPVPTQICSVGMSFNTFNLSNALGIRVSGSCGKYREVYLNYNQFNLSGNSIGLHIAPGRFYMRKNQFIQTGPATSQTQPPIAILLNSDSQQTGDDCVPYDSNIRCTLFHGGDYGELVPVSLTHNVNSDSSCHNRIKIAHNIFQNVPETVRDDNSSYTITPDSICNIWIHKDGDDTRTRCPATLPNNGFLHFTDGVTCGTKPENFVEPDCPAERWRVCQDIVPSISATMEPTQVSQPMPVTACRHQPHKTPCGCHDIYTGSFGENIGIGLAVGTGAGIAGMAVLTVSLCAYGFLSELVKYTLTLMKTRTPEKQPLL